MTAPETLQRPPLAGGATVGPQSTQGWDAADQVDAGFYRVRRVTFNSQGTEVVGNLFTPKSEAASAAVVLLGPVGTVKEQAVLQYASRLAIQGIAALIFDPRTMGESAGLPRRFESGEAKVQDLRAAIDFMSALALPNLCILGLCQGANWAVEAALVDDRVRAVALVAGHYLMPEVCAMYLGGDEGVSERIRKGQMAAAAFAATGQADYIPIVSDTLDSPMTNALLTFEAAQMYYRPWGGRNMFLAHRGQWENRITAMSEALLWTQRIDLAIARLTTPTLMVHADRAASGPQIPQALFESLPAARKELIWLGNQTQFQFYEDPITIDAVVAQIVTFLQVDQ